MKINTWIILFLLVLVANLTAVQIDYEVGDRISKPLLMPLLAFFLLSQTRSIDSGIRKWLLVALFFSWAGDILLMFQANDSIFFLLGLSSFLLAHIFYIIFYHNIRVKEAIPGNAWLMVIVVIYYGALLMILTPYLGNMKWPVRVYGIVISFMFMLAMHMLYLKNRAAGRQMMLGALFFIISDSLLAINKFYMSFENAAMFVMLTYGLAQLFIIQGAVKYIRGAKQD